MEALFFWIFAAGMLLSGVSVIVNRNPVASALSLWVLMCFMAALLVMLNAFFLAAVQVLVYAGAVIVLFLFIIMLLDVKAEAHTRRRWVSFALGLVLAVFFSFELSRVLPTIPMGDVPLQSLPQNTGNDVMNVGRQLFTKYMLPFQVVAVLLLVATVGVVLLSKRNETPGAK